MAPSGADIQAWVDGSQGAGNIALHLRGDVIGIDVDAYDGKTGAAALEKLTSMAGQPLPETWISTSRTDGISGIRLYRASLPAGRVWLDEPAGDGAGIEMVHRGHRYVVAWPSVHPSGAQYAWIVRGIPDDPPKIDEIPALSDAWIEVLSRPGERLDGVALDIGASAGVVDRFADVAPGGSACGCVTAVLSEATAHFARADAEALHPTMNASLRTLIGYGVEGHRGARQALATHHDAFVRARIALAGARGLSESDARAEWLRSACGAVGKLAGPGWPGPPADPCEGPLFDPGLPPPSAALAPEPAPDEQPVTDEQPVDPADWLLGQMLTPGQMSQMPAPLPLVQGLLALDSVAWLVSAPGSYKSFVALDLAAAVASGRRWMQRRTHAGPVLYMAAEGASGMSLRVRAHEKRHGPMGDVRFLPMPMQVADPRQWGALIEACRRITPTPVLVILDTQARVTVGLKENDSTDMGVLVDAMEALRRATGACVLAVHHTPKDGAGLRGSGALAGAAGTVLELVKKDSLRAVLSSSKQKDMDDGTEIALHLERVELGSDPRTGDTLSSLVIADAQNVRNDWVPDWVANLTENQAVVVGVMADIFPEHGGTKSEVRRETKRRTRPSDRKPLSDSSFQRAWDRLVSTDTFIQVKGSSRYVLASLHADPEPGDDGPARRPSASQILESLPFKVN